MPQNKTEIYAFPQQELAITIVLLNAANAPAEILSQWRGPQRDGVYPATNLLAAWPDEGPELLWSYEGLGPGHGAAAVAHDKIYVAGMTHSIGVLYAFDLDGKLVWIKSYGPEWSQNYPGPRATPTIVDDMLYFESGSGLVLCLNAHTGKEIWTVDLLKTFNADNIRWGLAESLLIDGDRVICTPGGPEHNIVTLNRFTGATLWTSSAAGQPAAYCSPILIEHNGVRLIVTMTAHSIIAIDADTGAFYWSVPQEQTYNIHANTPHYIDGKIICSSENGKQNDGIVALQLSPDAQSVQVLWRNRAFKNLMGGLIVKDGFIYGAAYRKSQWHCLDLQSGQPTYINEDLDGGVITYADGLFYCYADDGTVALVSADPKTFNVISTFKLPLGTDQHWAHPTIHQTRLYLRHGNALMAYHIAQ